MPKLSAYILIGLFCLIFFAILPTPTLAARFQNATIKLDNLSSSSVTGGTFCATPATFGLENQVSVTFPSDFNLNTNASNWTVNTSNLPSGANIWPGIGTASSVSGQTVTFPSSDLNVGTYYCFNFSGTNTLTTGSVGQKQGSVATNLDSSNIGFQILDNNQITVTATTGAGPANLLTSLQLLNSGEIFPQYTELQYELTYGNSAPIPADVVLQVRWSQGTIEGGGGPSVDILDYLVGTADEAYGGNHPVIDFVNRTITWTINQIPGNTTGQKLRFSLGTRDAYQGLETVRFDVSAQMSTELTSGAASTVTKRYKYNAPAIVPSSTPLPSASPKASVIPQPSFKFKSIDLKSISSDAAKIIAETDQSSTITIEYGTSLNSLSNKLEVLQSSVVHELNLTGLTPETNYYFRLIAKNSSGNQITSDIFTFKTAQISERPILRKNSIVISSSKIILTDLSGDSDNTSIIIPKDTVYEFKFRLGNYENIKQAQVFFRNASVLGVSTEPDDANTLNSNLLEVSPGEYLGKLKSATTPGIYELVVKVSDFKGNLTEDVLFKIKVVDYLKVLNKNTQEPIPNARVFLQFYNYRLKIYEDVSPQVVSILNPLFTNLNGEAGVLLIPGKYRAKVSGLGYKDTEVEFEINKQKSEYPVFLLEQGPLNLASYTNYYLTSAQDAVTLSVNYLQNLAQNYLLFRASLIISLLALIYLTFVAFVYRAHGSIRRFPQHFYYHLKNFFQKGKKQSIYGQVVDEDGSPVSRVEVSLLSKHQDVIEGETLTDKYGRFTFPLVKLEDYRLLFIKKGYQPILETEDSFYLENSSSIKVSLPKNIKAKLPLLTNIKNLIKSALGFSFEIFLTLSILVEVVFVSSFGLLKTLPLLAITSLNIFFWLIYLKNLKQQIKL